MSSLLKLPARTVVLATAPARFAVRTLSCFVRGADLSEPEQPPAPPRRRATPARSRPSPKAARRAARHEPTKGQAAEIRARAREEEAGEDGPGPEIQIDPRLVQP